MNERPFISVVMPTYNRSAYLEQGLVALQRQRYPPDSYEIIVVDDASTDGTATLLEHWQQQHPDRFRFLRQKRNRGPSAARNRGIAHAQGSIVAFTDDDCVVAPDWLGQIQRGYQEPGIAGVGGKVLSLVTESPIQRYYARSSVIAQPPMLEGQILYLITANASFRRDSLLQVGGFDERLTTAGGEEADLCLRLRRLGCKFSYNPQALVHHSYASSLSAFLHAFHCYGVGTAYCKLRHQDARLGLYRWGLLGMLAWPYRLWRHHASGVRGLDLLAFPSLDGLRALSFLWGLGYGYAVHGKEGR
jgi:glycosyltransferase involved in cell wall biosynthesis